MNSTSLSRFMRCASARSCRVHGLGKATTRFSHVSTAPPFLRNPDLMTGPRRGIIHEIRRHQSTGDRPLTDRPRDDEEDRSADADAIAMRKALSPAYQLWFTCKQCLERSGHTVSKQSYHFGTCVITCPKCKSQHLISDHLQIFSDKNMTLEDIAKEHGQKLKKGRLGANGDIEFYDDDATEKIAKG